MSILTKNPNKSATVATTKPNSKPSVKVVNEDVIRVRAYELYEQNGREQGKDVAHWLKAERELKRH